MPKYTYPCGAKILYDKEDSGKQFICKTCGQQHYYPVEIKEAKEVPLDFWGKFLIFWGSLLKRLSTKKFTAIKAPVSRPQLEQRWQMPFLQRIKLIPGKLASLPLPLATMKNELIQAGWRKQGGPIKLTLSPNQLGPPDWQACAARMLRHAEELAPHLSIPMMVPRIEFSGVRPDTGGSFEVDGEGYVVIKLKASLRKQSDVALAVLAHELCHYILGSNGIRKENTLQNEKLTDTCMFVLGFGQIFLRGYNKARFMSNMKYGYLTTIEYYLLHWRIKQDWSQNNRLSG